MPRGFFLFRATGFAEKEKQDARAVTQDRLDFDAINKGETMRSSDEISDHARRSGMAMRVPNTTKMAAMRGATTAGQSGTTAGHQKPKAGNTIGNARITTASSAK